jgi:hypothetical protein
MHESTSDKSKVALDTHMEKFLLPFFLLQRNKLEGRSSIPTLLLAPFLDLERLRRKQPVRFLMRLRHGFLAGRVGKTEDSSFLFIQPVFFELYSILILNLQVLGVRLRYVLEFRSLHVLVNVDVFRHGIEIELERLLKSVLFCGQIVLCSIY